MMIDDLSIINDNISMIINDISMIIVNFSMIIDDISMINFCSELFGKHK